MGLMKGLVKSFTDDGYLLMDTSYLVHTIAFRTIKIYSDHFDLPDDPKDVWKINFSEDEDFMAIFNRNFISTINKFLKKYRLHKENVVFAMDCRKIDIWRRSFFDSYKLNRIQGPAEPEGLNRGPLFEYVKEVLLPKLISDGMGVMVEYPIAEGDDIIAISKQYIRDKNPTIKIVIITCDHDFLQLIDDNCIISTIQENILKDKSLGSPERDLQFKILIGDGSDEIPSCFVKTRGDKDLGRGFGQKTCLRFMDEPGLLEKKFNEYPEARQQFEINKQIIDFRLIPESIRHDVEEILNEKIVVIEVDETSISQHVEIVETGIHSL